MHKIGKASTFSSLANESIHKKWRSREKIIEISKNYGAYGVNVAHSGTVVGILIDKSMNDTRLIELLKNERLDSVYKKMYTSNIIDGGIRGEQTWNTSKNPMMIEEKSFIMIQEIIDEIRPGYKFKKWNRRENNKAFNTYNCRLWIFRYIKDIWYCSWKYSWCIKK